MNAQQQWWQGDGGNAYTQRNRVDWVKRIPFWTDIVARTSVATALEVGCNFGPNLLALRTVKPSILLHGVDINESAISQAEALDLNVSLGCIEEMPAHKPHFGLVFTAGVLIHVSPEDIERTMRAIISYTTRYVLAIEYEAHQEEEITYRGERGLLWKRPYGQMYRDMGLNEIASGYLNDADGFDKNGVTWWLLEKP